MTQDGAQLDELFGLFDKSWEANDGEAVAGHFTADGSLVNPFGERADGRDAVAAMYSQYFGGMLAGTTISSTITSVRPVGDDHALVDGEQTITGSDGETVLAVRLCALLRRDGDAWCFADSRPYVVAAPPAAP